MPLSALVRLRGGDADLAEFQADLARVSGRPDIDVVDRADAVRHARDVTAFESAWLLAFGLAALLAAMVIVGQAIARYAASSAAELRSVAAVGMTGGQGVLLTAAAPSLAAAFGAAVGVAAAAVASGWMPFGAAGAYEPRPGIDLDWLVLGMGWLLVTGLVAIASAAAARVNQAAVARHGVDRPSYDGAGQGPGEQPAYGAVPATGSGYRGQHGAGRERPARRAPERNATAAAAPLGAKPSSGSGRAPSLSVRIRGNGGQLPTRAD